MEFASNGIDGADVSFYQDDNATSQQIDFSKMVGQGADFVIVRAGQNTWPDPDFAVNWRNARATGLPRGTYWLYDSRSGPAKQAELFASLVGDDEPELEMWIDLEETYGGPYAGYAHWKTFLNRLYQLCPQRKLGVYTSYGYMNSAIGRIPVSEYPFFSRFPLWLAWYAQNPADVIVPKPWSSCLYWQWGTPAWGTEWGCESKEIDMNLFNGTAEDFRLRYNTGVKPVEHYYKASPNVAGEYRSIRAYAYPNIKGSKIGQINPGSFAKCRIDDVYTYTSNTTDGTYMAYAGDRWLHVFESNGLPIDGWVAEIHLGRRYLTAEEIGASTPAITKVHTIEVYSDGSLVIDGVPYP